MGNHSQVDLDEVRAEIVARRRRHQEILRRHRAFDAETADGSAGVVASIVVRCDEPGHKSGYPKIAEVAITRHGLLYQARIPFFRSDQLTLRPWEQQRYLGPGIDEASLDRFLTDDGALTEWIENLDAWAEGHAANGRGPWLVGQADYVLLEVLDLPGRRGRFDLWARCPKHPTGVLNGVDELLDAARRAQAS